MCIYARKKWMRTQRYKTTVNSSLSDEQDAQEKLSAIGNPPEK